MPRISVAGAKRLFREEFRERLRQARVVLGINQHKAAEQAGGFGTDTWSRIERGTATSIPIEMLGGLFGWAAENDISAEWLFTGQGEMLCGKGLSFRSASACPLLAEFRDFLLKKGNA